MARASRVAGRLTFALLLAACLGATNDWQAEEPAQSRQEVVAAFPKDIPHSYFLDAEGQPRGFAHDVMEEIASLAGLRVRYLVVDTLVEAMAAVQDGRADIIPALSLSEERSRRLDFSSPLMKADIAVFMLRENLKEADDPVLNGAMGVVAGTTSEELMRERGLQPSRLFATYPEALVALLAGEVDAVVGQEGAFTALARRSKVEDMIAKTGKPVMPTYRAMAVRKGNGELLAKIEPEIKRFLVSSEYRAIHARWFGQPPPFWTRTRLLLAMAGLLALTMALMAAWRVLSLRRVNRLLRRSAAELDQAQAETRARAEDLQLILDTVPASIWFKDADNRFLRVNREAARLIGLPQAEIQGRHARELFPAWLADKYHQDDLAVISQLCPKLDIEEQYTRADGSLGWVNTHKVPWQESQGERFGVLVMSVDITQRKEMEQRHQESEERFRRLVEGAPEPIFVQTHGDFAYLNPAALSLFGAANASELLGTPVLERFHPDFREIVRQRMGLLNQEKLAVPKMEQVYLRLDGLPLEVEVSAVPTRFQNEDGALVFARDISERKRSERALRESEERFRQMAEMLPTAVCELDLDLRLTFLNGAGVQLLNLSAADLGRGLSVRELIHPDELPVALAKGQGLLRGEKLSAQEFRLLSLDGGERAALVSGAPVWRNGRHAGFLITVTDLRERKAMEEALRRAKNELEAKVRERTADLASTNRRLREEVDRRLASEWQLEHALSLISAAFDSVADGVEVVDGAGRMSFFNDKFRRMWSLPNAIIQARDTEAALNFVLDQLREPELLREQVDRALRLPRMSMSFVLELKDGRVFEVHSLPQRLKAKIVGRVWSFRDITLREKAERDLRRSEVRHRQVVDNAQEAILVVREGTVAFCNPQAAKITGLEQNVMPGLPFARLVHDDDLPSFAAAQESLISGGGSGGLLEMRLRAADGSWKWVEARSVRIEWEGRPATLHLCSDITERKEADAALAESMRVLTATLAASPVGIGFVKDRVLLWANSSMYKLGGYEVADLIGKPTATVFPSEEEYQRVGELVYANLSGDRIFSFDTQVRRKDGTLIDAYLQARLLDPADDTKGIIIAVTDIGERKRAEEKQLAHQAQLRRLLNEINVAEERERRRIASDLHDGLGQDLALMRIKLAILLDSPAGAACRRELRDVVAMIDKALQDAKALTWDLSAPMLRELGLAAALDWLAEQTRRKYGLSVEFAMEGAAVELDQTLADSLFRMGRELVLNAVKHAQCRRIGIVLTFAAQRLSLTVEDDGAGFDPSLLGGPLAGGFGLFNIGEMLSAWGGVADIQSQPGHGCRVRLETPLLVFS